MEGLAESYIFKNLLGKLNLTQIHIPHDYKPIKGFIEDKKFYKHKGFVEIDHVYFGTFD
jgi:hypothetical protein